MRLTGIAAALAIALAAGCGPKIVPLPIECPREEPGVGTSCVAGALCFYTTGNCDRTYQCVDGAWESQSDGCPEPPPPPTGTCPTALPTVGAPCKVPGQACQFTFPGDCEGLFVATCSDANQWSVIDQSPPCMPSACPPAEPMSGSPCTTGLSCTYTATPPGCPPETHDATCVQGAWQIETPGTCMP